MQKVCVCVREMVWESVCTRLGFLVEDVLRLYVFFCPPILRLVCVEVRDNVWACSTRK